MARVRAAVLREYGAPFSVEEVELEPPGPGWVLVRVGAVGVCGRDVVVWRGGFRNLKPPLILGHEVFGYRNGEPVGVYPGVSAKCGPRSTLCEDYGVLGENYPGGYAEAMYAPEANLVPLPDGELEKYAAAVCGVATFMHAARVAGIGAGDRVLVTGASGGVGIHGIQYLRLLGARVVAYTRSPEKAEILRSLGVEATSDPSFYRASGRVDAVLENVGAPTINWSMRALRPGGTLVLIGNVTGEPITIERPALLVMREISVKGSAAYTLEEYRAAVRLVGEGAIRPFYKTYRLDEVNRAYEDVVNGRVIGRAVLKP